MVDHVVESPQHPGGGHVITVRAGTLHMVILHFRSQSTSRNPLANMKGEHIDILYEKYNNPHRRGENSLSSGLFIT